MAKMTLKKAVEAINQHGILLVFPVNNAKAPQSLWSHFYPKTRMVWDWDDAPSGVVELWHLREELSSSGKVVYCKWYQGRATFFSLETFPIWMSLVHGGRNPFAGLSPESKAIFELLEEDSPRSSKDIKKQLRTEKAFASKDVDKGLKQLWMEMLIVGVGEVDDGAFPSLSIGATNLLFEDLWKQSKTLNSELCNAFLDEKMLKNTLFYKQLMRMRSTRKPVRPKKSEMTFEELTSGK